MYLIKGYNAYIYIYITFLGQIVCYKIHLIEYINTFIIQ